MSQPQLPGVFGALAPVLSRYGYLAIAAFVTLEDFGVPSPGETVLIAGAVYAGAGRLNVVLVALVGFAAAVVGDNIGFAIGHFGGHAAVERYGKYIFVTPERLDRVEAFFARHGGKVVTIARFVEGLRQANGIVAGISEMAWPRFLAYNALGAALWVGLWVTVGYTAGNHINQVYAVISRYELYVGAGLLVLLALFVAHRLRARRRKNAPRAR